MTYNHKMDTSGLWVVTCISNPVRYTSRYELFHKFKAAMTKAGVNLMVVEIAFGERPFEVTTAGDPNCLQLRTSEELWHKESMLNLGISRLPQDWKYVMWCDADVEFMRQDWPLEVVHQLQHYDVIQCFQSAIDLGPDGEVHKIHQGFVYSWQTGKPAPKTGYPYSVWHPGYVWAAKRNAIDNLGGLFDTAILGSADSHMSFALLGTIERNINPAWVSPAYMRNLLTWQQRANVHIRQNIGFMPGTIYHHWHGRKKDRKYVERWDIIVKHGYDPDQDLKRDWQGLWTLSDHGLRMRNDIRAYFRSRNEDVTEL